MLNVGIIGAGRGGTSILKTLLSVPEVEIIGVCDADFDSPGIKLAEKLQLPVYSDFKELLKINKQKLIIEATGSESLREKLYTATDEKTVVVHSTTALLISKIVSSRESINEKLKDESSQLSNLANKLSQSIQETTITNEKNINKLNKGAKKLIEASSKSQENIEETNQIVKFIRKVSEQTKMLGLNASIEAARANTNAGGFTVVANEIRKLADDTGDSIKRITHFTEELNQSVTQTLDNINKMEMIVEEFTETQDKITEVLNETADKIQDMSKRMDELSGN